MVFSLESTSGINKIMVNHTAEVLVITVSCLMLGSILLYLLDQSLSNCFMKGS